MFSFYSCLLFLVLHYIFQVESLPTSLVKRNLSTKEYSDILSPIWDSAYDTFKYSPEDPKLLECKDRLIEADVSGDEKLDQREYVDFIFATIDADTPYEYTFSDLPLSLIAVFNLAAFKSNTKIDLTDETIVLDLCSRVDSRIEDFIPHPSSVPTKEPSSSPSRLSSSLPSQIPTKAPTNYPSNQPPKISTAPSLKLTDLPISDPPSLPKSDLPSVLQPSSYTSSAQPTRESIVVQLPVRFPLSSILGIDASDIYQGRNNTVLVDLNAFLIHNAQQSSFDYDSLCANTPIITNGTSTMIDNIEDVSCDIDDYLYAGSNDINCSIISTNIEFEAFCLADAFAFKESLSQSLKATISVNTYPC